MAKLPEEYAEQRARRAMERAASAEKAREARAQKKLAELPTEEEIKKEVKEKVKKTQAKKKAKEQEPILKITNMNNHIKTGISSFAQEGTVSYEPISKENKKVKVCVEKPQKRKNGTVMRPRKNLVRLTEKQRLYYNQQNELVQKYFYSSDIVPKYNKYMCSCCGKLKNIEEFNRSYSYGNLSRADESSQFHMTICRQCAQKLFFFHYYNCNKNELEAMEHWCCDTNTYWSEDYYLEARKVYDNNPRSNCIVPDYIAAIGRNRSLMGKTYWDSPSIRNRVYTDAEQSVLKDSNNNVVGEFKAPLHWNKEQVKLRKKMINLLRYDPFELYPEEEACNMYYDLDLMIDDSMQEDLLKLKAAVEIVCSLHEIEKLRQRQVELERNGDATEAEIKALVNRRNSELKQITTFAKDNGFAERYAMNKAKGAGTLTGTMAEMREKDYEEGLVDFYGVQTCKEMQEVANMSFKAIFEQIGMTDNEAWGLVQKQTERIKKLQKELLDANEKLRRKEIELKRAELTYKAKQMQIDLDEDDEDEEIDNKEEIEKENVEENKEPEIDKEEEEYLSKVKSGEIDEELEYNDEEAEEYEEYEEIDEETDGDSDD